MSVTAFTFLNSDDTILRNLTESLSKELTNLRVVVCRNGSHLFNLVVVVVHLFSILLDIINNSIHSLVNTTFQIHRISTSCYILQTFIYDSLCQNCCSCCSITSIITSLRSNALYQLGTRILEVIFKFNFLSYGYTILGNLWSTKLLLNHNVTSFRTKCHFNCISQLIHAILKQVAGLNIEFNIFCHNS